MTWKMDGNRSCSHQSKQLETQVAFRFRLCLTSLPDSRKIKNFIARWCHCTALLLGETAALLGCYNAISTANYVVRKKIDELERICKEVINASLRYYPGICLERLRKQMENSSQQSVSNEIWIKSAVLFLDHPGQYYALLKRSTES